MRIDEIVSLGTNRLQMSPDLVEVMLFEGQAECLQKLSDLISGLVGQIRGKDEAERWLLIHV